MINHPSHDAPSQKVANINMESNSLLSMPFQKGMDIKNRSHPVAQIIEGGGGGVTISKQITPYVKKKKGTKNPNALGEHIQAIPKAISFENVPTSFPTLDVS